MEQAVELLRHRRVKVQPVVDLRETWSVDAYQTPPRMQEHVTLRYPVEVFAHGTLPGRTADKDHVVPYRAGAPPEHRRRRSAEPFGRHLTTADAALLEPASALEHAFASVITAA